MTNTYWVVKHKTKELYLTQVDGILDRDPFCLSLKDTPRLFNVFHDARDVLIDWAQHTPHITNRNVDDWEIVQITFNETGKHKTVHIFY